MVQNTANIHNTAIIAGTITCIATILYLVKKYKKSIAIPEQWMEVGFVTKLRVYPLKSGHYLDVKKLNCSKLCIQEAEKEDQSLKLNDRSFVVYNAKDNEFRTARTYPKLIFIELTAKGKNAVQLNAPGMKPLDVKMPKRNESKSVNITLFSEEQVSCLDCGDEVESWLSKYILDKHSGLRLAYNDAHHIRDPRKHHKEMVDFSKGELTKGATGLNTDLAAVHLINQASVDDLNERIGNKIVTAENFRPNIVVSSSQPYIEHDWKFIRIGDDVVVRNVVECFRCMFTRINPKNGEFYKNLEPLRTLNAYRKITAPSDGPVMGCYLKVLKPGKISVNDKVYVGV